MSGFILRPEVGELLGGVPVADALVEAVDLAALGLQPGDHLMGEGLLLGDAPAHGGGIADEGDARHAGRRLLGDGGAAEAVRLGAHRHAHQRGAAVGAVPVALLGTEVAHLHVGRVLPHLELVGHAVVDQQPRHRLEQERADHEHDGHQEDVLERAFHRLVIVPAKRPAPYPTKPDFQAG
jgi:hypothetical protein